MGVRLFCVSLELVTVQCARWPVCNVGDNVGHRMFLKTSHSVTCQATSATSVRTASALLVFKCQICSLQFLPHSGDRILITGAADSKVHVHDLTVKETIHMFGDHTNRVKRIATAPMWPNTFWSAAEDGLIRYGTLVVLPQN